MPYIPQINVISTQQQITDTFGGYNHNLKIGAGEFYDMENLSSSQYPLLANREKRGKLAELSKPNGLLAKKKLAYIDGSQLFYGGEELTGYLSEKGCTIEDSEKQLVSMGAYIVIFPDKLYINTENYEDCGAIDAAFEKTGNITYSICKADGTAYAEPTVSSSAPEEPENGSLWIDTSAAVHVLKQYSAASAIWTEIASVYTKIRAEGIGANFAVYDGVSISGASALGTELENQIEALNGKKIIYDRGEDYIVVIGLLDETYTQEEGSISVRRSMPDMDFITEAQNRLWGCKYGTVDGVSINEIYCCALGDFKNWNVQLFKNDGEGQRGMNYEIPPRFEGAPETQLEQLWSYLFRLAERLNVDSPTEQTTVSDGGFTARAYTELRDMIGTNAKSLSRISKDKVSHSELWPELEDLLRQAEESGEFDGNGIASATMDSQYRLTLEFTDGTAFTTPSLRGVPIYEIGDIFTTTREGEAAELLGYGTWSLLASSPAYMWQRLS